MSSKQYDYVVTHSGRMVSRAAGVPSEDDLALSLSRQPRFGGFCRRHWTVLDHSLFAAMLAIREGATWQMVMTLLLHDAHEWTGDIPTHFKTAEQKELQYTLDEKIFDAYYPRNTFQTACKDYDQRALLAEALLVGPPSFKTPSDVAEHFGARPQVKDVVALKVRLDDGRLGVSGSEIDWGLNAKNVQRWLRMLRETREKLRVPSALPEFQQGRVT